MNGGVDAWRLQALAVSDLVAELLDADPEGEVAVLGDFNEFELVSPLAILGERRTNLTWDLPPDERYTFVFEGTRSRSITCSSAGACEGVLASTSST